MKFQGESLTPTTPSTSPVTRTVIGKLCSPSSGAAEIYSIEQQVVHAPLPVGYTEIDDVIARRDSNPKRAAALARARERLANQLEATGPATLATLRLRCGLSQAALADMIGNSQPSYSKIEAGKSDPQFTTLEKLAEALRVSLEEVVRAFKTTLEQK